MGHALLLPILLLPLKQPTLPSVHLTPCHALPLAAVRAATALTTGAASPTMCAPSTSCASAPALAHSYWSNLSNKRLNCLLDLPGMRLNCQASSRDNPSSMRINCQVASQAKDLPSRRLNCSLAMLATNPCIVQCVGCHISRHASPLKHLAAALRIRACYGPGPHLSEGHRAS